jgi:hypothetical protein
MSKDWTPMTDQLDLDEDPFDDDLQRRLAATAPRRIANRTTVILAGVVLAVGGFIAGAQVQKHFGATATGNATTPATANGNLGGGQGRGGFNGGFNGGGQNGGQNAGSAAGSSPITGTVKLVDGTTIYVETADGRVITVRTTDTTTVQIARSGSLKDIAVGTSVTVEGSGTGTDTVTATKVTKAQ